MPHSSIQFTLDNFEGPLDLLLHLIQREEVDIYDIPIARITEQYMEYMAGIDQIDLELAGEFMVMAATLLEIKSRMLLPKPPPMEGNEEEDGVDPREELVQRLLEYKRYKELSETFREWEELRRKMFTRPSVELDEVLNGPAPLAKMDLSILVDAFKRVLDAVGDSSPVTTLRRERFTVRIKMIEVWNRIRSSEEGIEFSELFEGQASKLEVIVTFLSILELLRLKKIIAEQNKIWGQIHLQRASQQPEETGVVLNDSRNKDDE